MVAEQAQTRRELWATEPVPGCAPQSACHQPSCWHWTSGPVHISFVSSNFRMFLCLFLTLMTLTFFFMIRAILYGVLHLGFIWCFFIFKFRACIWRARISRKDTMFFSVYSIRKNKMPDVVLLVKLLWLVGYAGITSCLLTSLTFSTS